MTTRQPGDPALPATVLPTSFRSHPANDQEPVFPPRPGGPGPAEGTQGPGFPRGGRRPGGPPPFAAAWRKRRFRRTQGVFPRGRSAASRLAGVGTIGSVLCEEIRSRDQPAGRSGSGFFRFDGLRLGPLLQGRLRGTAGSFPGHSASSPGRLRRADSPVRLESHSHSSRGASGAPDRPGPGNRDEPDHTALPACDKSLGSTANTPGAGACSSCSRICSIRTPTCSAA